MVQFIQNSRKPNLIHSDRKPISGCLEPEVGRRMNYKGHEKTFRGNRNVLHLDGGGSFMGAYFF